MNGNTDNNSGAGKSMLSTEKRRTVQAEDILRILPEKLKKRYFPSVEVWDKIDSTNTRAAQLAKAWQSAEATAAYDGGYIQGTFAKQPGGVSRLYIIVAHEQTEGRGTRGRRFFSPPDSGIYMSLLFFPEGSASDYPPITAAAAVAVCRVLDRIDAERGIAPRAGIKWVNDIFIDGRKVCGILAEGSVSDGVLQNFTVGIGMNVSSPKDGFPTELQGIAGAAFDDSPPHETVIAYITEELANTLDKMEHKEIMRIYRERSTVIGKNISVAVSGVASDGIVTDINDEGQLIIRLPDGSLHTVTAAAHLM